MSMRMPNKSAAENNKFIIHPQPLFTRLGTLLLIIGMVVFFFVSQLIGIYIAGKLVLPTAKSATVGDIFFFGSNDENTFPGYIFAADAKTGKEIWRYAASGTI